MSKIITVTVKANSKKESIKEIRENTFKVEVNEVPEKGKANNRVLKVVAEYFKVPVSRVVLISGATYKEKKIMII